MHEKTRAGQPAEGFVYVMEAGGYYKIGWTHSSPRKRRSAVQMSCPLKVTLVGVVEGTRADEHAWHEKFHDKQVQGEWFQLTEEDIAHILHDPVGIDAFDDDHIA